MRCVQPALWRDEGAPKPLGNDGVDAVDAPSERGRLREETPHGGTASTLMLDACPRIAPICRRRLPGQML